MKRYVLQMASIAFLVLGTLFVFWFNASSASRDTVVPEDEHAPIVEDVEGTDNKEQTYPPDLPSVIDPSHPDKEDSVDPGKPDAWQVFLEELAGKGMTVESISFKNELSFSNVQRIVYSYMQNGSLGLNAKGEQKANLWLYEGLLLSKEGSRTYIGTGEGKTDITGYLPVYACSENGQAVFYREGGFYAWNSDKKTMQPITEPAFLGLYYDNAPAVDEGLTPYFDDKSALWGYRDKEGKTVIAPAYRRAFPFGSDGVAAVQKNKTSGLVFIDKKGKTVYDSRQKLYVYNGTEVYDLYVLPETLTGEGVGQLFFENGYVLAVANTYATHNSTEILRSRTVLASKEGKLLSLPEDYTVRAYSQGVLVLEKQGYYGYYSCEGYWITDPIYKKAEPFAGGLGVVIDQKGNYMAVDKSGNSLLSLPFSYLSSVSNGKMLGYRTDKGWMLFSVAVSEE